MRVLIVFGVIGVMETDCLRCGANVGVTAAQEHGGAADRIVRADMLRPHRLRGVDAVARINSDHHQAIIEAGTQSGFGETGGGEFHDRSAQRAAGEVSKDHYGGHATDGIPNRPGAPFVVFE